MADIICAIDVGTTKICALIAEVVDEHAVRVLGVGRVPSEGLAKGVVVNVAAATAAIGQAVEAAEQAAKVPIGRAYVGIAGSHVQAHPTKGVVPVNRTRVVTVEDVERAKEAARAIALPHNREAIHLVTRSFAVDEQEDLVDPVGMHGYRLTVDAHVISGATGAVRNLRRCVEAHGIEVEELVLQPLASAEAVLTPAERDMGVVLADIGGGTTDLAILMKGSLCHTVVLDVGGNHLTHDLAVGLNAPLTSAEQVKVRYGNVLADRTPADQEISMEVFGDVPQRPVLRQVVNTILAARAEEMVELILREVKRSGYDGLVPAGLVLTGGSAQMAGLRDLARTMSRWPVRVGLPTNLAGLPDHLKTPDNATGVGLLLWGLRAYWGPASSNSRRPENPLLERIVDWLRNLLPG
ncbi:MAG: cell division protein FtsA [Caldilineales bacterium]|nr:cell division protein FtsA [Caldilineales bacterium]MDW8316305.1 cell division protein FtsA [Anaerolineae bacterium]